MWSITIGSGIYLARGMCNVMGMGYSHTQIYTHTYIRIYIHTYIYIRGWISRPLHFVPVYLIFKGTLYQKSLEPLRFSLRVPGSRGGGQDDQRLASLNSSRTKSPAQRRTSVPRLLNLARYLAVPRHGPRLPVLALSPVVQGTTRL